MALVPSRRLIAVGLAAAAVVPSQAALHAAATGYALADGGPGIYAPVGAQISAGGRYVVFAAVTTPEFVVGQGEGVGYAGSGSQRSSRQIYLVDTKTHRRELISVNTSGKPSDGNAGDPGVSSDGRYVVFSSAADDLVRGDTNLAIDVFVRDRLTHKTRRVDLTDRGQQLVAPGFGTAATLSSISADGSTVVFYSAAKVLAREGAPSAVSTAGAWFAVTKRGVTPVDVDPKTGLPRRIGDDCYACHPAAVSRDGRYVAFGESCVSLADLRARRTSTLWCPKGNTPTSPTGFEIGTVISRIGMSDDGRTLVWDLTANPAFEGSAYEIVYAYSARTGKAVEIDGDVRLAYMPTVSANGSRAVFVGRDAVAVVAPYVAFMPGAHGGNGGASDDARGTTNPPSGNATHTGDVLYSVDLSGATPSAPVEISCDDTVACTLGGSYWPSLSADGKTLAFVTLAQLAADDPDTPMTGSRSAPMDPDDVYVIH